MPPFFSLKDGWFKFKWKINSSSPLYIWVWYLYSYHAHTWGCLNWRFFSDWRGIDHIKLCRMIAQLYKTIKYQCIIVKRAQFCDKTLAAAKALWYLGLMNLHHLLCHLRANFYVTNFTIWLWETELKNLQSKLVRYDINWYLWQVSKSHPRG